MSKEFWIVGGLILAFIIALWIVNASTKGFKCPSGATCSQVATVNGTMGAGS